MEAKLDCIPLREVLHMLGWRGTTVDESTLGNIREMTDLALGSMQSRVVIMRRPLEADGRLAGTMLLPKGQAVAAMLEPCHEAVLIAGTLGVESERLLLRMQAQDAAKALLMDAVLSAAIESVLDQQEEALRGSLALEGLYLTDRFSPGYGDMPLGQTKEICEVLDCQRQIGLTVSSSGIMIPRKSVTAIMGISAAPVARRAQGCEVCGMKDTCALSRVQRKG